MFDILIPIALGATVLALSIGLFGMMKGGEFNRKYANKLMRLRIVSQAVAVVLIVLALWLGNTGN